MTKEYKIKTVPSKQLEDYEGMNIRAAKKMGYPWHYTANTILVREGLSKQLRRRTIIHEQIEKRLMEKGYTYWKAHKKALQQEKQ